MSKTDLIPAQHAAIFWNVDWASGLRAPSTEVLVIDVRSLRARGGEVDDPRHLTRSLGALSGDWMQSDRGQASPEGVFALVWLSRGASLASVRAALREFAKIDTCAWARTMLAAIDGAASDAVAA